MGKHIKKISISMVTASVAMTSLIGFGSIASAATIYNTGPGSNNVIGSSYNGNNWQYGNDWNNWNPVHWQNQNFNNWWPHVTNYVKHYNANNWHHQAGSLPAGWYTNVAWQNNWNNWSPQYWQAHEQSYDDWCRYTLNHFNNHSNNWRKGWGNQGTFWNNGGGWNSSYNSTNNNNVNVSNNNIQTASSGSAYVVGNTFGGVASTGSASNVNNTQTNVNVSNRAQVSGGSSWVNPNSASFIGNTGPLSNNRIHSSVNNNFKSTNNNNVNVTNSNTQTAHTGSASVKGNTFGGTAVTGAATNTNLTHTGVHVKND